MDVEHDQWKKYTLTYHHEKKSTLVCSRDTTTTPSQRPLMNQTKFGLNFTRTKRAKNQLEREREMKIDTVDLIQETQFSPIYFKSFSPAFFQVRLPVLLIVPTFRAKEQ